MSVLQSAASVAELVAGVWAATAAWFYNPWYWCSSPWGCVSPSALALLVPYLGGILVMCAAVSFFRLRFAFISGGAVSAVLAGVMGLIAVQSRVVADVPLAMLSADAAVLGFWASRHRSVLSEQANPMNLPVFG